MHNGILTFGPFRLDATEGHLQRGGVPVPIGQRALAILAALAEAKGMVVSKDMLIAAGWPGMVVEEGNLTVQVAALRKALGDGDDWIVTVPRQGYRLRSEAPTAISDAVKPNLAVLPFRNLCGDAEQDYFVDGVTEDLITALSRFRSFAVIARGSAFAYRGRDTDLATVGSDLGVRYVVNGSLRRAGDRLRITAELADVETRTTLWSNRFEGTTGDVFAFQDRITEQIVTHVAPQIEAAELVHSRLSRQKSLAAYDVALRAHALILEESQQAYRAALDMLMPAIARDPGQSMLLGYACWALEHGLVMGWPDYGEAERSLCRQLAEEALKLRDIDTWVTAHCGLALLQVNHEYARGFSVVENALAANPNSLEVVAIAGTAHLHCGDIDTALELFGRARELSPRDPFAHIFQCGTAHAHAIRREFEAAHLWAARSHATNVEFDPSLWILAASAAQLDRFDEAVSLCERLQARVPEITIARLRSAQPAYDPERMAPIWEGLRRAGLPEV
jgi:TolB-like protein